MGKRINNIELPEAEKASGSSYAWVICGGCMLVHFCIAGLGSIAFSVYLPLLKENIPLSFTEVSMITAIRMLSTTVFILFTGKIYEKLSLRSGLTLSCFLMAVSCFLFSIARSAGFCFIISILMGMAYAFGTLIPISAMLRNWFRTGRSYAIGLASCGSSAAALFGAPVLERIAEMYGFPRAFRLEGLFIIACGIILLLILRDEPGQVAAVPYTWKKVRRKGGRVKKEMILSTKEENIVMLSVLLLGLMGTPYAHHLTIHYTTSGFLPGEAASAFALFGGALTVSKMLYGEEADRIGAFKLNLVAMVSWAAASLLTAFLPVGNISLLYLSALISAIGCPLVTIGSMSWCEELSNEKTYAGLVRRSQFFLNLGGLIGSVIPGILADLSGSYSLFFIIAGITVEVSLLMIQFLLRGKRL